MSIVLLILAACGNKDKNESDATADSNSEGSGYAEELKIGLDVDADTMDPRLTKDYTARRANELIYDGLVYFNEDLEANPALAESWDIEDNETYIFHLRDDVKFHDGESFTAEDVKYTYDALLDEETSSYYSVYEPIESVEIVDEYTVKFTLKNPYSPILGVLDIGIVPAHLGDNEDFPTNPVGTGPYKLENWDKNNKIEFSANEEFWGGEPETPKITYYIIPENNSRIAALEAGDVNLIHSPLTPQDIVRLQGNESLTVERLEIPDFNQIKYNVKDEVLSDGKVRKAISHLINRGEISSSIYDGIANPDAPLLAPLTWDSTAIHYPDYNPEEAARLLAEANWVDSDNDGILDKDGKKLSIVIKTHSEDSNRIQIAEYLQNEFTNAGIETEINTAEFPTFYADVLNHDFQLALFGSIISNDPDRALALQYHTDGSRNDGQYSNPKVDELISNARETLDAEERMKSYQEAAQILVDEVAFSMTVSEGYTVIYSKDLEGFKADAGSKFRNLAFSKLKK